MRRQRQRIYRKSGRSPKYIEIKSKFDLKLRQAADKYHAKIEAEVREGKRNNSYSALRKLGGGGKSAGYQSFSLPSHIEDDLSPEQCANRFADYFSKISQEFQPIDVSNFQPNIQSKLKAAESESSKPVLEEWQVYGKLQHSKKPNSTVPGDLPVKLVKTLSPELAKPVTCIYNRITQSGKYPRQWVIEHQLAIPKVSPPLTEDDTRNIASTAYLSKQYESFIADWLMPYIEPFIDPGQCGGLKGSSITHYLVKLLNFVHVKLDMKQPHAVLLALIDMEKAFNRVSHQLVIEDLADMNVPGWLLLILISYLTERYMYMRLNILTILDNLMQIREKKTNIMKVSFSRSYNSPPELSIQGFGEQLEVVQDTKLLGVLLSSHLKWSANTPQPISTIRTNLVQQLPFGTEQIIFMCH